MRNEYTTLFPGHRAMTSDGVHCEVITRRVSKPRSRAEVIKSLPVSEEVCAQFCQRHSYVAKVVEKVEQETDMEFHVEADQISTRVWRVA